MRDKSKEKRETRKRRHKRIIKRIKGTSARPRLCVFRSLKHIYAQLIDDVSHRTICSVGAISQKTKMAESEAVGKTIAEKAQQMGIKEVVFDRGGYLYHGRVKAVAEAARKAGLKF
ncbi:MAG: 50S ribosomal protein L18 [Candidatus Edwardsbacteria bacterium]